MNTAHRHTRRDVLRYGAAAAAAVPAVPAVLAQAWPSRPIKIICPFAPGGSSDIVARLLAQHMAPRLGQPVVVENRPGAGGTVSAQAVKTAPADGYTLMMANTASFSLAPTQFRKIPYDTVRDFTHCVYIGAEPTALFVSPSLGVNTLAEFVALGRSDPKRISYGSSGVGSAAHINGDYFKKIANFQMLHVPYKGMAPMITDFKGGFINAYFTSLVLNMPSVEAGECKAIGSLGRNRVPGAPDVRTFREQGYDLVSENWFGFSTAAGLPAEISARIDAVVKEVLKLPEVHGRFVKLGIDTPGMTTAEFSKFVADQIEVYKPRILAVGAFED
jgi:tripartite-type tricarboxylate transporter receptor subunit TctC